jgi:hypothetical protein
LSEAIEHLKAKRTPLSLNSVSNSVSGEQQLDSETPNKRKRLSAIEEEPTGVLLVLVLTIRLPFVDTCRVEEQEEESAPESRHYAEYTTVFQGWFGID